jgi:redox-sensitive bicupin YhaK (pirin superfamily)
MSAGTGILHSEFNPSAEEPVHLYQIWIRPDRAGHTPRYAQRDFSGIDKAGKLVPVVSPAGEQGTLSIHQDAWLYLGSVEPGKAITHELRPGRHAWLQMVKGELRVQGVSLTVGDAAALSEETHLTMQTERGAEVMLFDLP